MERNSVTVRVPATTANLGPGYDCVGMALDVWCEVTVTRADTFSFDVAGEGADKMPRDETNYIVRGVKYAFECAKKPLPVCKYQVRTCIPYGAGMGSSSAGIVAGLMAGLVLAGHELPVRGEESLVQMASAVEGHPDNVAPAIYGGFQLGSHNGARWFTERVPTPHSLQCVLLVTNFQNNTHEARKVVPKEVPMADAVFNISRTSMLVLAFATNRLELIAAGCEDRLHQIQRSANLPHLVPALKAAMAAGAHGAFLSGSGPTVCAITSGRSGDAVTQASHERTDAAVGKAMVEAAKAAGLEGVRAIVTKPTEQGAHIVSCDPPFSNDELHHFSPLSAIKL